MKGELVWTSTPDRTRLNGFFVDPTSSSSLNLDAAIVLHGLAGNFYSSGLLVFVAKQLSESGLPVLLGNTRGHDILNVSTHMGRSVLGGAAIEKVDDCRHDIEGWLHYLNGKGLKRILLVGHSLGAIKSLYGQAYSAWTATAGILALSSTRLNYHHFANCSARDLFLETFQMAKSLVDQQRGDELVRLAFPFPTWMSASSFVEKYGPENRFDWAQFIERIDVPMMLAFGERELDEHPAFEGVEQLVRMTASNKPNLHFSKVENADHFYVACFDTLWQHVRNWLRQHF